MEAFFTSGFTSDGRTYVSREKTAVCGRCHVNSEGQSMPVWILEMLRFITELS